MFASFVWIAVFVQRKIKTEDGTHRAVVKTWVKTAFVLLMLKSIIALEPAPRVDQAIFVTENVVLTAHPIDFRRSQQHKTSETRR